MKTKIFLALLIMSSYAFAQVELSKKTVLENQVIIKIPEGFKQLEEIEINKKFAIGRRPNVVFSNDNGTVNLTLDLKSTQINQGALVNYQANYGYMFSQYRIDKTKNSSDIITVNNHKVGFFKLLIPERTGKVYTLMFYTNIGNQLLIGSFYCPINEQKKWQETANEILNSLVVKEI